jgi:hypothetical protein
MRTTDRCPERVALHSIVVLRYAETVLAVAGFGRGARKWRRPTTSPLNAMAWGSVIAALRRRKLLMFKSTCQHY